MLYLTDIQSTDAMDDKELALEFFLSNGFHRNKCKVCGRHFWSLGEHDTCGESPCVEYSFIGNPIFKEKISLRDMRESFLSFLERNGHTRIGRYPITARWRDDVFFTQASIYDFQPWVINGVVDPPANPLAISQTCVRFNDIDNVGRTGSHLTMFEMMAHHVFNKSNKMVYWKDRTVELCFKFMTEVQGADPSIIRFIEAWWEGGGNAGPCVEVIIGGVEAATLVFMQYLTQDGKLVPMDMQVVDTGYGLERLTWMSQGTPTAYDAIFGEVLQKLKSNAEVSGDENLLGEYSKVAGLMKVENSMDLRELRAKTAKRLGIPLDELIRQIEPIENAYNICDHSRALAFLLNDGVVPSNVKRGYFARLLIRRAMRALKRLDASVALADVVGWQIDHLGADFPELVENRGDITLLIKVEEDRYADTVARGRAMVERMEGAKKATGQSLSTEDLIEMYDSNGITPDMVQEFASSPVSVPDDFYIQVSKRHERADPEERTETGAVRLSREYPSTRLLFYEDPYRKEFTAKILGIEGQRIIMEETYFYAESGGQESDSGQIGNLKMSRAEKIGNIVAHIVEGSISLKEGEIVDCRLDWDRRRALMRHHTATHVVNGVCRRILGNHIYQTGANKSTSSARLDITHYADLTREQLDQIETESNQAVLDALPIISRFLDRNQAEKLYGFRLYQGGAVPGKEIRVVNIEGLDVEACGGTHCTNTSEIGSIKILGAKRIQDGVVRLEYAAGLAAINHIQRMSRSLKDSAQIANSSTDMLPVAVQKLQADLKDSRKEIDRLKTEMLSGYNQGKSESVTVGDVIIMRHSSHIDQKGMIKVAKNLIAGEKRVAVVASSANGMRMIMARSSDLDIDCSRLLRIVFSKFGGSSGGKPDFAQGGGTDGTKVDESVEFAVSEIRKEIEARGKS
jgi:alanyl-tRNA synthetase